jgi:UDP-glucose 4-epimerase
VFGRDPRLQFIHVDDALEVLTRSVIEDHRGTFNVAGPGVMVLSQAIRRAGRVAMPVIEPGMSALAAFARTSGLAEFSLDQLDLFVHGRVVDVGRLRSEFGFTPRSTPEAFEALVEGRGLLRPGSGATLRPTAVAATEAMILDGIRALRATGTRTTREPVHD